VRRRFLHSPPFDPTRNFRSSSSSRSLSSPRSAAISRHRHVWPCFSFRFYGLATLNALILGKIMLIAENMRFTKRFDNRPLVVPIAYKSIVFAVLLLAAYIVEEIGVGMFHGKTAAESFPVIAGGGPATLLCVIAIMAAALAPFFAFREIARVVGEAEFRVLMLGAPRQREDAREDAPPLAAAAGQPRFLVAPNHRDGDVA
jgi:hypothetical protein